MSPVRPINPVRNICYPRNFRKISNGVNIKYGFMTKDVILSNKDLILRLRFRGLTG